MEKKQKSILFGSALDVLRRKTMKIPKIKCPICGGVMVAFRREITEEGTTNTFWEYGWLCDCNEKIREEFKTK